MLLSKYSIDAMTSIEEIVSTIQNKNVIFFAKQQMKKIYGKMMVYNIFTVSHLIYKKNFRHAITISYSFINLKLFFCFNIMFITFKTIKNTYLLF